MGEVQRIVTGFSRQFSHVPVHSVTNFAQYEGQLGGYSMWLRTAGVFGWRLARFFDLQLPTKLCFVSQVQANICGRLADSQAPQQFHSSTDATWISAEHVHKQLSRQQAAGPRVIELVFDYVIQSLDPSTQLMTGLTSNFDEFEPPSCPALYLLTTTHRINPISKIRVAGQIKTSQRAALYRKVCMQRLNYHGN
ncbi:hypothetical protein KIN20_027993 [Parelaphostrongylus tenuis]|uniref:Uncharacterized protein n=1 Tax=Parelaphostrongylus tenuis TaxID=148309 RepID=A0AAD5R0S8_PARTN|nr:hypothetical protein KIN20_027993 [Parelaphostrongylus tenuis]